MFKFDTDNCYAYQYNPATKFGDLCPIDRHYSTIDGLMANPEYQAGSAILESANKLFVAGYISNEEYNSMLAKAKRYLHNAIEWQKSAEQIDWAIDDTDAAGAVLVHDFCGAVSVELDTVSNQVVLSTKDITACAKLVAYTVAPGRLYIQTKHGNIWLKFAR